ncbi:unnamed protein product [Auanema sp. JU1783]|nr:unnamed protein product [Auanema sp. JU1783]
MRCFTVGILVFSLLLQICQSSPVHSIWNVLPLSPAKRMYGLYQHLPQYAPAKDYKDKRTHFLLPPIPYYEYED